MRILLLFLMVLYAFACNAQCEVEKQAFKPGEKLTYKIYYNWGPVWVHAGLVDFSADTINHRGHRAYHFISTGKSKSSYDWFFKVRDVYESWADRKTLQPIEFYRNTSEGGYNVRNWYLFDQQNKILTLATSTSKRPYSIDSITLNPCLFDVLTASYYARCIPFENLKPGDKIPISTMLDDDAFNLYIRYISREKIHHRNGKDYQCLKFKAKVAGGSVFKGNEDITVWVTDDARHIPVKIEAKILVGSVMAYIDKGID